MTRSTAGEPAAGSGSQPPVFFAGPGDLARDLIVLARPEGRHAADVRRLAAGERVDLTDGEGQVAECVVTRAQRGQLELAVRHRTVVPAPDPALAVVQAIPKGERGQLAVELMTEAGVNVIVPWAAQRCVARWEGERGERAVGAVAVHGTGSSQAGPAEPGSRGDRARRPGRGGRAGRPGRPGLHPGSAARDQLGETPLPGSGEMLVIVGPEGGVTPAEAAGAHPGRGHSRGLGPTVFRTSSAGMAAAAILLSRAGRWA